MSLSCRLWTCAKWKHRQKVRGRFEVVTILFGEKLISKIALRWSPNRQKDTRCRPRRTSQHFVRPSKNNSSEGQTQWSFETSSASKNMFGQLSTPFKLVSMHPHRGPTRAHAPCPASTRSARKSVAKFSGLGEDGNRRDWRMIMKRTGWLEIRKDDISKNFSETPTGKEWRKHRAPKLASGNWSSGPRIGTLWRLHAHQLSRNQREVLLTRPGRRH